MAALLVMMAIMAILMTVAMPVWRHEAQREKEEEAIFRGFQYARAIAAYRTKMGTFPTNVDVLVEGRYLRKKYKDPFTKEGEWQLIPAGVTQTTPGVPNPQNPQGRGSQQPQQPQPQQPGMPMGGIGGVASKSQETSIRTFRGATRYNLWQFTWQIAPNAQRGGGPGGRGGPGGPGGQTPGVGPNRPGGPTNPPGTSPTNPFGGRNPGGTQPPTGGRGPGRGGRGL